MSSRHTQTAPPVPVCFPFLLARQQVLRQPRLFGRMPPPASDPSRRLLRLAGRVGPQRSDPWQRLPRLAVVLLPRRPVAPPCSPILEPFDDSAPLRALRRVSSKHPPRPAWP